MNNEPETVIVTVGYISAKISIDMELPVNLPVAKVKVQILEILKNVYAGIFSNWANCNIIYGNHFLSDDENLTTASVYDGSYLYIAKF